MTLKNININDYDKTKTNDKIQLLKLKKFDFENSQDCSAINQVVI